MRCQVETLPPGKIRRVHCRVWLRQPEELRPKLTELVRTAIGLDESRGDTLVLETGSSRR